MRSARHSGAAIAPRASAARVPIYPPVFIQYILIFLCQCRLSSLALHASAAASERASEGNCTSRRGGKNGDVYLGLKMLFHPKPSAELRTHRRAERLVRGRDCGGDALPCLIVVDYFGFR